MPIYDIFETKPQEEFQKEPPSPEGPALTKKDRFFSSLTARLLFFLLFLADICWIFYAIALFSISASLNLLTWNQTQVFKQVMKKQWIGIKRSLVCGISLLISLFSPALGIMVACTYFLMYDKSGIQEVVPASLQEQFQEFMR